MFLFACSSFRINTKDVAEAPTGWGSLLNEEFKGKIATADPVKSSSAFACIMAIMGAYGMENGGGYEFLQKLIDNLDGIVLSSSSAVYKGTADGEYAAGLTYAEPVCTLVFLLTLPLAFKLNGVWAAIPAAQVCAFVTALVAKHRVEHPTKH